MLNAPGDDMLGRSACFCLLPSSIPGCGGKPDTTETGGHETALEDADGDGRADILVCAWFNGDGGASAGATFLYVGL